MTEQPSLRFHASPELNVVNQSTSLINQSLSERFRKPSVVRAVIWASMLLYFFWWMHTKWLPPMPPDDQISGFFNLPALRFKFFMSGPVPYAISLTFLIGLQYLVQIVWRILRPLSILFNFANLVDLEVRQVAKGNDLGQLRDKLIKQGRAGQLGYYGKRFSILLIRWERDKDIGAVSALKNEVLESDEEDVAIAFTAISWVEWTLPLLGFFGTVIGIGGAISSVQKGVSLLFAQEKLNPEVLALFNEGFKGLALAFDTTFQGLLFLIIVGGLHFMLRKSLASSLAMARVEFAEFVAKWAGAGGEPPIINVHNFSIQMEMLEVRMDQLQDAIEVSDRRAIEFREDVRSTVERVVAESPNLEWVRKVLFVPVVEFSEVWLNLAKQVVAIISTKVGHKNWSFTALSVSAFSSHGFVAAIEDQNKPDTFWLFLSDLDAEADSEQNSKSVGEIIQTNLKIKDVYFASTLTNQQLLVTTQTGELRLVSTQFPLQDELITSGLHVEDSIFPVTIEAKSLVLIVRRKHSGFDISCSDFASDGDTICHLSGNTNSALWAFDPQSAKMLAAIKKEGRWHLHILQFSPPHPPAKEDQATHQLQPKLVCPPNQQNERSLPAKLHPRQLFTLSADEILILDEEGNLHYWNKTRPVPIKLKHASWPLDPKSKVLVGADGWIAVAAHGHLTMWRIQRGGHLYPYEKLPKGLAISGIDVDSLVATGDGSYLLGKGERLISIWEFPRYAIDEVK